MQTRFCLALAAAFSAYSIGISTAHAESTHGGDKLSVAPSPAPSQATSSVGTTVGTSFATKDSSVSRSGPRDKGMQITGLVMTGVGGLSFLSGVAMLASGLDRHATYCVLGRC